MKIQAICETSSGVFFKDDIRGMEGVAIEQASGRALGEFLRLAAVMAVHANQLAEVIAALVAAGFDAVLVRQPMWWSKANRVWYHLGVADPARIGALIRAVAGAAPEARVLPPTPFRVKGKELETVVEQGDDEVFGTCVIDTSHGPNYRTLSIRIPVGRPEEMGIVIKTTLHRFTTTADGVKVEETPGDDESVGVRPMNTGEEFARWMGGIAFRTACALFPDTGKTRSGILYRKERDEALSSDDALLADLDAFFKSVQHDCFQAIVATCSAARGNASREAREAVRSQIGLALADAFDGLTIPAETAAPTP